MNSWNVDYCVVLLLRFGEHLAALSARSSDARTAEVAFVSSHPPPPPWPPYLRMGTHKFIIGVESLSDVTGSEGLVMEIAVCDMFKASTGRSDTKFTLAQQIRCTNPTVHVYKAAVFCGYSRRVSVCKNAPLVLRRKAVRWVLPVGGHSPTLRRVYSAAAGVSDGFCFFQASDSGYRVRNQVNTAVNDFLTCTVGYCIILVGNTSKEMFAGNCSASCINSTVSVNVWRRLLLL